MRWESKNFLPNATAKPMGPALFIEQSALFPQVSEPSILLHSPVKFGARASRFKCWISSLIL